MVYIFEIYMKERQKQQKGKVLLITEMTNALHMTKLRGFSVLYTRSIPQILMHTTFSDVP